MQLNTSLECWLTIASHSLCFYIIWNKHCKYDPFRSSIPTKGGANPIKMSNFQIAEIFGVTAHAS